MAYKYESETRGHVWERYDSGEINMFGYENGTHNGPVCTVCGYGFCHHCNELPQMDCPGYPLTASTKDVLAAIDEADYAMVSGNLDAEPLSTDTVSGWLNYIRDVAMGKQQS